MNMRKAEIWVTAHPYISPGIASLLSRLGSWCHTMYSTTAKQSIKHGMTVFYTFHNVPFSPQNSSSKHYKRQVAYTLAFVFHYRIFCTTGHSRGERDMIESYCCSLQQILKIFVVISFVCISEGREPRLQEINSSLENQNLWGKRSYLVKLFCSLLLCFVE